MKSQREKVYAANSDPILLERVRSCFPGAQSLLDVGCGSGGNSRAFKAAGYVPTGITISEPEAALAAATGPVFIHDLSEGLPAGVLEQAFDVVVAAHVLEHVFYPDRLLEDIVQVCRFGLVVVVPNLLFWRNRIKLLLGRFEYQDVGIMDYTHSRWYTFRTIQDLLRGHGFEIRSANAVGISPTPHFPWFNRMLLGWFPGWMGFQFYVVATPPTKGIPPCP